MANRSMQADAVAQAAARLIWWSTERPPEDRRYRGNGEEGGRREWQQVSDRRSEGDRGGGLTEASSGTGGCQVNLVGH
jgi:hypothetical protein